MSEIRANTADGRVDGVCECERWEWREGGTTALSEGVEGGGRQGSRTPIMRTQDGQLLRRAALGHPGPLCGGAGGKHRGGQRVCFEGTEVPAEESENHRQQGEKKKILTNPL